VLIRLGADHVLMCWSPAKKQNPSPTKNDEMLVLPMINNSAKLDEHIHISTSVREFDREGDLLFEGFNFDLMSSAATCM
jgi:hypothetical protein